MTPHSQAGHQTLIVNDFIMPGGTVGAATLQQARTVCRRAERVCVTLNREEGVNPQSMAYLNRLSDALFVMGRFENKEAGIEEPVISPAGHQVVMVALDANLGARAHNVQAFHGPGSVSHDVTQAPQCVAIQRVDAVQHRGQRLQIAMDVGYDGDAVH